MSNATIIIRSTRQTGQRFKIENVNPNENITIAQLLDAARVEGSSYKDLLNYFPANKNNFKVMNFDTEETIGLNDRLPLPTNGGTLSLTVFPTDTKSGL